MEARRVLRIVPPSEGVFLGGPSGNPLSSLRDQAASRLDPTGFNQAQFQACNICWWVNGPGQECAERCKLKAQRNGR